MWTTLNERPLRGTGPVGLVDQRTARPHHGTGRADARLAEVIQEVVAAETNASTGRYRRDRGGCASAGHRHRGGPGPALDERRAAGAAYRLLLP